MSALLPLNSAIFIFLYGIAGVIVTFSFRKWIIKKELLADDKTLPRLTDPYEIAYLRKGEVEAIKVATVSLIDRELLIYEGDNLETLDISAIDMVNRPIEKSILTCFEQSRNHLDVFQDINVRQICNEYKESLVARQLIADNTVYKSRLRGLLLSLSILISICCVYAFFKIFTKRSDLIVCIVVMLFFCFIVIHQYFNRLTAKGNKVIKDLRFLFNRLVSRAKFLSSGGNTNEVALVAAIFGLRLLPEKSFPFVNRLYSPSSSSDSGASLSVSSDSSSSCGSCCGSGCGSGCGGGCGS